MKTGRCKCGNRLFFANVSCLKCNRPAGRCHGCFHLTGFDRQADGSFLCTACGIRSHFCLNRNNLSCNSFNTEPDVLCSWCQFTTVTPDLTKPQNQQRWAELERAKRRLLVELRQLDLPPFVGNLATTHPLSFQFLEDIAGPDGQVQKVYTGHDQGVIVINVLEADSVHREQMRVALGEPQRTLIGHMRHEAGHYLDWAYASRVAAEQYHELFGDPEAIEYDPALKKYYEVGPPSDWAQSFASAYATMHPWEDFAETVNVYLDIMAIGVTANDQGMATIDLSANASLQTIVAEVLEIVVMVSEFNFDFGFLPLLPERLNPKVVQKLAFVHELRSEAMMKKLSEVELTVN
ncbi:MAG: putative zinc-binding metallopeptidase [Planctomycetaceae bacterium]